MKWIARFAWLVGLLPLTVLAATPEVEEFRIAFYVPGVRDANPADLRVTLQLWAEEIGVPYGFKARAFLYENINDLHRDVHDAKVDLVVGPGMELAETFHPDDFADGFTGLHRNTPEGLALVAARQIQARQLTDLRGKRLTRLSNDRLSDLYLAVLCAREAKSSCTELFQITEEKRDVQSIHKVFFGKADAALVRLSTLHTARELNPQIGERLVILREWRVPALSLGLLLPHTSPSYRARIVRSGLDATKTPRGKQILEMFKADYMEQVDKSALLPFVQLHREYQALPHSLPPLPAARK